MSWFKSTPESEALLAEERLVLAATEAVSDAMLLTGTNKQQLAELLKVKPSEISQRLSGRRNLTLRSLAKMLHALGWRAELTISPAAARRRESIDASDPGSLSLRPLRVVELNFKAAEFDPIFVLGNENASSRDPLWGFLQSSAATAQ